MPSYVPTYPTWEDWPSTATPIRASTMQNIDAALITDETQLADHATRLGVLEAGGAAGNDAIARALSLMQYLVADEFSGTVGQPLVAADTGQTYEQQEGAYTFAAGNKATSEVTSTWAANAGTSNVRMRALITPAATGAPGLAFRMGTTAADKLAVQFDATNGLRLNKWDNDASTPIERRTEPFTFTAGQPYWLDVVAWEDIIAAFVDGVLRLVHQLTPAEQTKYGALTRVGLRNSGTATGKAWDHFQVWLATERDLPAIPPNIQTGTAYTLAFTDRVREVWMDNAAANTLTAPNHATVAFPLWTTVPLEQRGIGQTTVAVGAGMTLDAQPGPKLRAQGSTAWLRYEADSSGAITIVRLRGDLVP